MFTGDDCSASYNNQPSSTCTDFGNGPNDHSEIFVKICASENHLNPANVWKTNLANLGSSFFFTNRDVGQAFIPEWTHIFIFKDASEEVLLQHIVLRSYCDVPLELNDQWGSLRLVGIEGEKGGFCGTATATLLPLSFVYFNASQKDHSVEIGWGVSGELFEGKMEVQHSEEGRYFNAIATISASGVSGVSDYLFIHLHPSSTKNYYRLKIFNEDGSATFSQIEIIKYDHDGRELVFPNPVEDNLRVVGSNKKNGIEVLNMMGVKQFGALISEDHSHINMSQLPAGIYFIVLYDKVGKTIQQVMKI